MITELGHFALILAFAAAIAQMTLPFVGVRKNRPAWMAAAMPAVVMQLALTTGSLVALSVGFVTLDFSIALVTENVNTQMPVLSRISAVWGAYEGSLLLWALILALFGAVSALSGGALPHRLRACALAVHGAISTAVLGFILFASNPFLRLETPPFEGAGATALLQDQGLALAPFLVLLGSAGLAVAFSFAVAALIEGRNNAHWSRWLGYWSSAAWIFLTVAAGLRVWRALSATGIGAVEDPSGQALFALWVLAAGLACLAVLTKRRAALARGTILVAIVGFGAALFAVFFLQSDRLFSGQTFARDLLGFAILAVFTGGGLGLFAARARAINLPKALSASEKARLAALMAD